MNKKELYRKLVEEITLIDMNRFNYNDSFRAGEAAGKIKGLESAKKLLNQLDEPELPVIPQFVADYLDDFKKQNLTLGDALDTHFEDDKQIHTWLYEDGEVRNDEVFARAWLDGYTIKKDDLYLINLGDNQYARKFNKTKIDSLLVIKEDAAEFTEQEIKAIDERYWAFGEPVE